MAKKPKLRPIPTKTKVLLQRNKLKTARPIQASPKIEAEYSRNLEGVVEEVIKQVETDIVPIAKKTMSGIVPIGILSSALVNIQARWNNIRQSVISFAEKMVRSENEYVSQEFSSSISPGIGEFTLRGIITDEKLQEVMRAKVEENVDLIQSLPDQYLDRISSLVYEAATGGIAGSTKPYGGEVPTTVGGETPPTTSPIERLVAEIQRVSNHSLRRAQLIARDQTAKANAALVQVRQQRLGIQEYVWQTCQDDRVRPTHNAKQGKIFRWDSPPADTGHPGHDYYCRCVALAVIPR